MDAVAEPIVRLTAQDVCARWRVADRTLRRYVADGILSPPLMLAGRRVWSPDEVERAEAALLDRPRRAPPRPAR